MEEIYDMDIITSISNFPTMTREPIKAKDQFGLCGASEKNCLERLSKAPFSTFLKFSYEEEITFFFYKFLILRDVRPQT